MPMRIASRKTQSNGFLLPRGPWPGLVLMAMIAAGLAGTALLHRTGDPAAPAVDHTARIAARLDPAPLALPPPFLEVHGDPVDRDWTRLAPTFGAALQQLSARMASLGYELILLEGYRSPERQTFLARAGSTPVPAMHSLHQHGLAADLGFVRDGQPVSGGAEPWIQEAYQALGREAEQLGPVWGGRWVTADRCHVQASLASPWCLWKAPPDPSPELP